MLLTKKNIDSLTSYFKKRGYKVKLSEHCLDSFGFLAGKPEDLANDFNMMVKDNSVKMIMPAYGGVGAIHLLPLLDYDLIEKHPKIFCAYSDPSILLNTITLKTGVPTFHGIDGETFALIKPDSLTEKTWISLVTGQIDLPFNYPTSSMEILKPGKPAVGRLFGGNLRGLLVGTKWLQIPENSILFFEGVSYSPVQLDQFLAKLKINGVLESINGLIIGRYQSYEYTNWWGEDAETLEEIVLRNCEGYDFPIVSNVLIGHTEEKITLPIGARFKLDTDKKQISLLEDVVF